VPLRSSAMRVSIRGWACVQQWLLRWALRAHFCESAGMRRALLCCPGALLPVLFLVSGAVVVCAAPDLGSPLIRAATVSWQGVLGLLQVGAA
jgi:hypothetical protein